MGGDKVVAALCGDEFEDEHGDDVRDAEGEFYGELIGEVQPFVGARALLEDLKESGHTVILASSAGDDGRSTNRRRSFSASANGDTRKNSPSEAPVVPASRSYSRSGRTTTSPVSW